MTPKRIGTVYGGILRRPPRHLQRWRYQKRLALKSMIASGLAAVAWSIAAVGFVVMQAHPYALTWSVAAVILIWSFYIRVRIYRETKR